MSTSRVKIWAVTLFVTLGLIVTGSTFYLSSLGLDPYAFYANMANPYMRFVHIPAGLRREETAQRFKQALAWSPAQVKAFIDAAPHDARGALDGYYMPGDYFVRFDATGANVAHQMQDSFNEKVGSEVLPQALAKKSSKNDVAFKQKINLDTAVRIASIIQREAGGKSDMNLISGIIWNRIFRGMDLEMDATLQYVKGTSTNWWPQVKSADKYIDSPFNTYQNGGLPPTAISNPGISAIAAAYNPQKTDCIFYLHDNDGQIHCTSNYKAHKENVQKYLIGLK